MGVREQQLDGEGFAVHLVLPALCRSSSRGNLSGLRPALLLNETGFITDENRQAVNDGKGEIVKGGSFLDVIDFHAPHYNEKGKKWIGGTPSTARFKRRRPRWSRVSTPQSPSKAMAAVPLNSAVR